MFKSHLAVQIWAIFFLYMRVFFTDIDDPQDSRGREGTIFYSTLPLPPAHEHSDIYLQLCMWDDYHVFLIAPLVFTRLLLDEIYHFIELTFEWLIDDAMFVCSLEELILRFCYNDLTLETGGFELPLTITKYRPKRRPRNSGKGKFPQAVITNRRTLPPVFPNMFWTAAWRKTPDGCFWHDECKTIYLCSKESSSYSIYWNMLYNFLHGD